MIAAQLTQGGPIIIPPGDPLLIRGPVKVPPGIELVIQRDLLGTSKGRILLEGQTVVRFERSRVRDVPLQVVSGTVSISGLEYSGRGHVAAILIAGPGPYKNLRIENFRISDANYGILRQGANSTLDGATIRNGSFVRLFGDGIEWNVCTKDNGVVVEDIDIEGIDAPSDKLFWGIGIGFAGSYYNPEWAPNMAVKNFSIRRVRGRSLRQLIHVENGQNFTIEEITGMDISEKYSAQSGIQLASVVCYGCTDFSVTKVNADAQILLISGTLKGRYIVPCSNFEASNMKITRGGFSVEIGGLSSFAALKNIELVEGVLKIRGQVERLELTDLDITSPSSGVEPLVIDKAFLEGEMARFLPKSPTITRNQLHLRSRT
ncbi:hypothetical protein [Bradyrhizobium sp. 150]|uniref:hypothetical protein n=1 Tax=Bradyrhizobium sp. 150 TaxID=2782625 RepID=UPI001FF7FC08|nr:hypothetical protein [Bradyrhizobium sp. 150]MCK1675314.1 hypothetical protein [Bradyrhizobium sp. 150]